LKAEEIDLDTRILTVCDVYDALISKRVYRAAWTHDEALGLLRREAGTAFDERCVAALERVVSGETAPSSGAERLSTQAAPAGA
jgi:HD-GYP domain-containing protein (c-di-GMP phosphodiesterase class II)